MKEKISALMDSELDGADINKVIAALSTDDELKATWNQYHLIGDAMRASSFTHIDVRKKVEVRLVEEPTVLAPRRWLRPGKRTAGAIALAASVSFAAVVGWQQLSTRGQPVATVAMVDHAMPVMTAQSIPDRDDPYLLAHQEMTSDQDVVRVSYGNGASH